VFKRYTTRDFPSRREIDFTHKVNNLLPPSIEPATTPFGLGASPHHPIV